MPFPNPFNRTTISYHRMSKDESEDDSAESSTAHKEEEDPFLEQQHFRPRRSRFRHTCGYLFVAILSLVLGLISGQFMRVEYEVDGYMGTYFPPLPISISLLSKSTAPYGHTNRILTDVIWNANTTFSDEPSEITEAAWASLIPEGRGFVMHPKLAPGDKKSVSVFHELHCLVSHAE